MKIKEDTLASEELMMDSGYSITNHESETCVTEKGNYVSLAALCAKSPTLSGRWKMLLSDQRVVKLLHVVTEELLLQ